MKGNARKNRPITANQCRKIHAMKNSLALSDDDYRAMLHGLYGVESSTSLSSQAAGHFIEELETLTLKVQGDNHKVNTKKMAEKFDAKQPKCFDKLNNRPGFASGAQLRMIEGIWSQVSIIPEPDGRVRALRHFIKRITGVDDMRFLDSQNASKIICALTTMQKQATEPAKAQTIKNGM